MLMIQKNDASGPGMEVLLSLMDDVKLIYLVKECRKLEE